MIRSVLFLLACIVCAGLAWGAFYIFGEYVFAAILTITLLVLLSNAGKPKFGSKKESDNSSQRTR